MLCAVCVGVFVFFFNFFIFCVSFCVCIYALIVLHSVVRYHFGLDADSMIFVFLSVLLFLAFEERMLSFYSTHTQHTMYYKHTRACSLSKNDICLATPTRTQKRCQIVDAYLGPTHHLIHLGYPKFVLQTKIKTTKNIFIHDVCVCGCGC